MKTILAIIIGTAVSYFLGWLVFDKFLADFFGTYSIHYAGLMKEHPLLWTKIAGHLLWVILILYVLNKSVGHRDLITGLLTGLTLAFLFTLGYDLFFYGGWNLFAKRVLVVHIVGNTVIAAVTGSILGLILKD